MTTELPDTHRTVPAEVPLALKSNLVLGPLPEGDVTALSDYVDADGSRQSLAYSVDQVRALLAEQRQRCAQYCHDQRMALRAVLTDEDNGTWHDGVADGWGLAAVALRKGPNG